MLARVYRLHKNKDIVRVIQKGSRVNGNGIRMSFLFNNRSRNPRATVIVSAKAVRRAVDRNLVKRQIRSAIHEFIKSNPTLNVDIVISVFNLNAGTTVIQDCTRLLSSIKSKF